MRQSQAVVGGGSLGGMLAAQVLSKYFDEVLVLDREVRKGDEVARFVPQMNHNHFLHHNASVGIERVFPGFIDIIKKKCFVLHPQRMAWNFYGNWLNAAPAMKKDLTAFGASRTVLEMLVELFSRKIQKWKSGKG